MLLSGYGSYGIATNPTFSSNRVSLLDRGVVVAIAHIRGGGEMGKAWHEQGRMMHKKNTFTDFIAAAQGLIAQKYTSSDRLVITGGSAGGLLMGAVVNLRPDLFKAVVAEVPFVDVVNTMNDASLPLTVGEYEEWGNPKVQADYDYIKTYCPYTNTAAREYPAMLGAGQVGGEAAVGQDREPPAAVQDQHGRRPRRLVGPLRRAARDGVQLRVHPGPVRHPELSVGAR